MTILEDHLFRVEVDIIQFDQDSDRVVINGYLGDKIETEYIGQQLLVLGSEASISLHITPEELKAILQQVQ